MSGQHGTTLSELQTRLSRQENELVDLRERADQLEGIIRETKTAIAVVQELMAIPHPTLTKKMLSGLGVAVGVTAAAGAAVIEATNRYRGMTILDATKKYLELSGPATAPEIARALEFGGLQHDSDNFVNTVYSILHRAADKRSSGIEKVGRTWRLTPRATAVQLIND